MFDLFQRFTFRFRKFDAEHGEACDTYRGVEPERAMRAEPFVEIGERERQCRVGLLPRPSVCPH